MDTCHPGRVTALYKYLSAEAARALFDHGRIRIGTLYEYRDPSERSVEITDRKEGRRQVVVDVDPRDRGDARDAVHRAVRDHGLDAGGEADVRVVENGGSTVVVEAQSPNLYLFSASKRCDQTLMRSFEYEACVQIASPDEYFRALTEAMTGVRSFLGFREVIYEDPENPQTREAGIHPAFFKRVDYAHQQEVRALWEPDTEVIEPIMLECPAAARFCELQFSRDEPR